MRRRRFPNEQPHQQRHDESRQRLRGRTCAASRKSQQSATITIRAEEVAEQIGPEILRDTHRKATPFGLALRQRRVPD